MLDGGVSVGDYWGCGGEDFFGVGLSGYLGVFEVGGFGPVVYCFGDGGYGCLCGVGLVWVCGVCGVAIRGLLAAFMLPRTINRFVLLLSNLF